MSVPAIRSDSVSPSGPSAGSRSVSVSASSALSALVLRLRLPPRSRLRVAGQSVVRTEPGSPTTNSSPTTSTPAPAPRPSPPSPSRPVMSTGPAASRWACSPSSPATPSSARASRRSPCSPPSPAAERSPGLSQCGRRTVGSLTDLFHGGDHPLPGEVFQDGCVPMVPSSGSSRPIDWRRTGRFPRWRGSGVGGEGECRSGGGESCPPRPIRGITSAHPARRRRPRPSGRRPGASRAGGRPRRRCGCCG